MNTKFYDQVKTEKAIKEISNAFKDLDLNFLEAYAAIKSLNAIYRNELKERIKALNEESQN